MKQHRVISADSHAIEPPDLWQQYLPTPTKTVAHMSFRNLREISGCVRACSRTLQNVLWAQWQEIERRHMPRQQQAINATPRIRTIGTRMHG